MITAQEIEYIRKKLKGSVRPLFFFDDDPDGVSSFVQLYKYVGDGKGVCVKGKPVLEQKYAKKVEEFGPDLVIILDKPLVEQEFIDSITQEIIWIDHHPLQNNKGVKYFNPRKENPEDNTPTSYWVYQIVKEENPEFLWIAMLGIVGDWNLLLESEFRQKYPELLPETANTPDKALFNSKLGSLIKIVDFNLKGSTTEVMKSIKTLTRIEDPLEIINQTTSRGKFLYKKYLSVNKKYEELLNQVKIDDEKLLVFRYHESNLAISSQLSNELLFKYPDKIIIVIREKSGELMMSIRSGKQNVLKPLQEALKKTNGYGGGHDKACGACIKTTDYDSFIDEFKKNI